MFLFKKLVGPLLFPHSVLLALLAGSVLMLWFSKKQKLARILVTIATAGFIFLSYPLAWSGVVEWMESRYAPLDVQRSDLTGIQWIVVLGGGGTTSTRIPASNQLSAPSLARLVEGIRIQSAIPDAKLLVSGRSGLTEDSDALLMQQTARILGVAAQSIAIENKARDTEEQAEEIRGLVGSDRFILVTSAVHMTRSMALFAKQGLVPIPAPTDFFIKTKPVSYVPDMILPSSAGAPRADSLFREFLGMAWEKLRGRI